MATPGVTSDLQRLSPRAEPDNNRRSHTLNISRSINVHWGHHQIWQKIFCQLDERIGKPAVADVRNPIHTNTPERRPCQPSRCHERHRWLSDPTPSLPIHPFATQKACSQSFTLRVTPHTALPHSPNLLLPSHPTWPIPSPLSPTAQLADPFQP